MLLAVDFHLRPPKEIAIVGDNDDTDTNELLRAIRRQFVPNKVMALIDPDQADAAALIERIPWLENRTRVAGKATVYICESHTCKAPVTTPRDIVTALVK